MTFSSTLRSPDADVTIFAAAFEGDIYDATLQLLASAFPDAVALIVGQERDRPAGNFLLRSGGPEGLACHYQHELTRGDGWARRQWHMQLGQVYDAHDLGADEAVTDGPLARAFAARRPALDAYTGVVCSREGGRQIAIELRYPRRLEGSLRQPLREFLGRIAHQLGFAVRIAQLRNQVKEGEQLASNLLDLLPFPVMLFDATRHVRRMNGRARAMIGAGMMMSVGPDRILRLSDPDANAEFLSQLETLRTSLRQRVAIMTVPQASGGPRDILSLVRLNGSPILNGIEEEGPLFAVACENLAMPMELSQDILWRVFGLSAKEAELALSLLAGNSIGDLAVKRQVSKETLRNQLSAVMRKTHTGRQQDLVALLTRLAAVNPAI